MALLILKTLRTKQLIDMFKNKTGLWKTPSGIESRGIKYYFVTIFEDMIRDRFGKLVQKITSGLRNGMS